MNDLVSTILIVVDDEIESFWCFKGLMDRLGPNFHKDQTGLHTQFEKLKKLLHCIDSTLYDYLLSIDALNMIFCYRWLLILFRREFPTEAICVLWEVFLTNYYHKDFPLFFALAILIQERSLILEQKLGFDGILRHLTELADQLDHMSLLGKTSSLYLNFEKNTDDEIKSDIFG